MAAGPDRRSVRTRQFGLRTFCDALQHFLLIQHAARGARMHNHPSCDPTPSRADIQMTQAIVDVAKPLGIAVHDHIIVGKDGHASLKGLKLI